MNRNRSTRGPAVAGLLTLAMAMRFAGPVHGNGALPQSQGLLLAADRPEEIILATNIGLMLSEDGGASWMWTCEQSATSGGYLYSIGPPPRDRIYALSPTEGLAYSDDGSCSWHRSGGVLQENLASDYFVDPTNGDRVLAVAAARDDAGGVMAPAVYASMDGGATFAATPIWSAPDDASIVVGLEISRSDPQTVYLATYTSVPGQSGVDPTLVVSTDGGKSWSNRDLQAAIGSNQFRILAVDPADPRLLYLRVVGSGQEQIAVTRDAGATVTMPLTVSSSSSPILSAFARLASGTIVVGALVGLPGGGTTGTAYRSTDGAKTFQPWDVNPGVESNMKHLLGAGERSGVLYLAGKNLSDPWTVARSTDEGAHVAPIMSGYDAVRGIKACAQSLCASACVAQEGSNPVFQPAVCTGGVPDAGMATGTGATGGGNSGGGCVVGRGLGAEHRRDAILALLGLAALGLVTRAMRRPRRR